jgi:hypothetical protein
MKAAEPALKYFSSTNLPHAIVWPGYWGWKDSFSWGERLDKLGKSVFENMYTWSLPLIQCNFSSNAESDVRASGPSGLSVVVNSSNRLAFTGAHKADDNFLVHLVMDDSTHKAKIEAVTTYPSSPLACLV